MTFRNKECHFPVNSYSTVDQSITETDTVKKSKVDNKTRKMKLNTRRNITIENEEVDIENRD